MPTKTDYLTLGSDRLLGWLINVFIESDATLLAHTLVLLARLQRRNRPVQGENVPASNPADPHGPFLVRRANQQGDLIIFVPRSVESYLIDEATGRYGYSHVALDCGEVELLTGKPVMTEATMHNVVHRSFQDKYGPRPFIRVPLQGLGINIVSLCKCAQSMLGEPYDSLEALTWGDVHDPAKQICTGLVGDCLPSAVKDAIAHAGRAGKLGRRSVSAHRRAGKLVELFVSPNAFAKYFGAPPGRKITGPDVPINPRPGPHDQGHARRWLPLFGGLVVVCGLLILWLWRQPRGSGHG
jgi:hypothetical protein